MDFWIRDWRTHQLIDLRESERMIMNAQGLEISLFTNLAVPVLQLADQCAIRDDIPGTIETEMGSVDMIMKKYAESMRASSSLGGAVTQNTVTELDSWT